MSNNVVGNSKRTYRAVVLLRFAQDSATDQVRGQCLHRCRSHAREIPERIKYKLSEIRQVNVESSRDQIFDIEWLQTLQRFCVQAGRLKTALSEMPRPSLQCSGQTI